MAPPDMCATVWPEPAGPHLPFSLLAGRHGATINSGNAGRYDVDGVLGYCAALKAEIADGRVERRQPLRARARVSARRWPPARARPLACGTLDGFSICVTEASAGPWRQAALAHGVALSSVAPARR